jgi:acetoin utilization protein AcuB
MLVRDCMTRHPILISPKTPAAEAQRIMGENRIRHLPVTGTGKRLLGLITRQRLAMKPDDLASLNVWEITRRLSNMTAEKVMLPATRVHTIGPDKTVERAASLMTDYRIGCLPVMEDGVVVGIITETDLLRSFQVMLGIMGEGVRVTVNMPDRRGEFAKLMQVIVDRNWGVVGVGTFPNTRRDSYYYAVVKISNVSLDEVRDAIAGIESQEITDIRTIV